MQICIMFGGGSHNRGTLGTLGIHELPIEVMAMGSYWGMYKGLH